MAETTVEGKECLITLVNPGRSDSCIKVFPAEHATEKIWLDNTPGKERWGMISRAIHLHASRFSPIPTPMPWHADPRDLKTVTMSKEDIPMVKLENFVLQAPVNIEDKAPEPSADKSAKEWDDRMNKLEGNVGQLGTAVAKLTEFLTSKSTTTDKEDTTGAPKRGPGRPKTKE